MELGRPNMDESKETSMNEELLKWIDETKQELKAAEEKKDEAQNKQPSGKCEVCGDKTATAVCLKCKRSVCTSCYFKLIGICKKCVPEHIANRWDGSSPNWERELGVEWIG